MGPGSLGGKAELVAGRDCDRPRADAGACDPGSRDFIAHTYPPGSTVLRRVRAIPDSATQAAGIVEESVLLEQTFGEPVRRRGLRPCPRPTCKSRQQREDE